MATKKKTEADSKGKLKFSSPLDMQEHDVDPLLERAMQAPVAPVAPVGDWREGFEKEYGWLAPNNVIGFYRAILQELYRLRVGK